MTRRRRLLLFAVILGLVAVALGWLALRENSQPKASVIFVGYTGVSSAYPVAEFVITNADTKGYFVHIRHAFVLETVERPNIEWFEVAPDMRFYQPIGTSFLLVPPRGTNRWRLEMELAQFGWQTRIASAAVNLVRGLANPADFGVLRGGTPMTIHSDWITPTNFPPPPAPLTPSPPAPHSPP